MSEYKPLDPKGLTPRQFDIDGQRINPNPRKVRNIWERKTYQSENEKYFGVSSIRVIEYSAYLELQAQAEMLAEAIETELGELNASLREATLPDAYAAFKAYENFKAKVKFLEKQLARKQRDDDLIDSTSYAVSATREAKVKDLEQEVWMLRKDNENHVKRHEELKKDRVECRDLLKRKESENKDLWEKLENYSASNLEWKAQAEVLADSLHGFVEYFSAIERGDYAKNKRPAPLRTFEQILKDGGKSKLKAYEDFKAKGEE